MGHEYLKTPIKTPKSKKEEGCALTERKYEPPASREKLLNFSHGKSNLPVQMRGEWTVLRKNETPFAELFSVSYLTEPPDSKRPITFVFNGGPGASSAYLHLGALGPKGVAFGKAGEIPNSPSLNTNLDSWIPFTDLVFIDPIGTGLSRLISEVKHENTPPDDGKISETKNSIEQNNNYFSINRDLESIGEFIQRFLSSNNRWLSPIFLCGESYGGYRVAKLVRKLPNEYGISVAGAILVSPALEPNTLDGSDYNISPWIERIPTMAVSALFHNCSPLLSSLKDEAAIKNAIDFATSDFAAWLIKGTMLAASERTQIITKAAGILGVSESFLTARGGRISTIDFANELLRSKGLVTGLYDASQVTFDPFPDRAGHHTPDPTLHQSERIFTSGIHHLLWHDLELTTQRRYHLMSHQVNMSWKNDMTQHIFHTQFGATDDLRFGMALNPYLKVWVTHGLYDLVTPFFASERLQYLMKLPPTLAQNLSFSRYQGGHMYYTWPNSRRLFSEDAQSFFQKTMN
jgi:carboxypeptidase C (cathepsin A)